MNGNFGHFQQELNSERDYDQILYRLYVVTTSNGSNTSRFVKSHEISKWNAEMSSIIAMHDIIQDRTDVFLFPNKTNDLSAIDRPIYVHDGSQNITENVFDLTLNYCYRSKNIRINSFYTKVYVRYERMNISFEVYPQKNLHQIASINTFHYQLKETLHLHTILVEDKIQIVSNESIVTFGSRLWEAERNKVAVIYQDVKPKLKEVNQTEL